MRILQLTDLYPPYIGGMEEHVRNLSHGLAALGHEVAVATVADGRQAEREDDAGVTVHRLRATSQRGGGAGTPSGRPFAPPFPDPELALGLRRLVREFAPHAVHAHNWLGRSFMPLKARAGTALVVTLHDYGVACAKRSYLYRGLPCTGPGLAKCLRCAAGNYGTARGMAVALGNWAMRPWQRGTVDMFLAVSHAVARDNRLAELRLPHEVVPNFVPDDVAERADPRDPALAALPATPYWLFVGALSAHKGLDVLLDAYSALDGAPPLVLVGADAPDTPLHLPADVVVLRNLRHAAVMAAWQRATLGIVPSVFPDPCPTVALEAMAAGVPLVASHVGGLPDMVADGESGLLVPPADARALRAALASVAADPARARLMGEAGRQRVGAFSASTVIARVAAIYARLVGAAGAAREPAGL
jgi:glycosyltransferase involved in cell wall biosynthesis